MIKTTYNNHQIYKIIIHSHKNKEWPEIKKLYPISEIINNKQETDQQKIELEKLWQKAKVYLGVQKRIIEAYLPFRIDLWIHNMDFFQNDLDFPFREDQYIEDHKNLIDLYSTRSILPKIVLKEIIELTNIAPYIELKSDLEYKLTLPIEIDINKWPLDHTKHNFLITNWYPTKIYLKIERMVMNEYIKTHEKVFWSKRKWLEEAFKSNDSTEQLEQCWDYYTKTVKFINQINTQPVLNEFSMITIKILKMLYMVEDLHKYMLNENINYFITTLNEVVGIKQKRLQPS